MDRFQNTAQPDWDWWGKLWPAPGETLRQLGITSDHTLAEVPSGNGYFALPAARITDPNPIYALDLDESALDELTHLAEQQSIENIVTLHGDARDMTHHLPEPVDVVFHANSFHGVVDTTEFIQQVSDSLRSGGWLIVVNWHDLPRETTTVAGEPRGPPTDLRMTPDKTEMAVLDAADFTLDTHIELPPYHYALRFER
ncbi:SAM-dependent methyltransferase [Haladaptatus sp. W1]|uniref:class I SAM-dependent methyltransferase n=1 Tax=Haladaptatus sp. W1 TaxID=1897478 RepID=UPI000849AED4|nr:class I SAM-dependent methyltransferase [Haladaptatus sp. W1]ODR80544.1 SAM-dependent methyltransferase [Haladaptatus sp. W1]